MLATATAGGGPEGTGSTAGQRSSAVGCLTRAALQVQACARDERACCVAMGARTVKWCISLVCMRTAICLGHLRNDVPPGSQRSGATEPPRDVHSCSLVPSEGMPPGTFGDGGPSSAAILQIDNGSGVGWTERLRMWRYVL
jgi:hypothetical protein